MTRAATRGGQADKTAEHRGVDPNGKDWDYGKIRTLTNEEARRMEVMDYDDIRRGEKAEERMSAVDSDNAGAGSANYGQFKSSYWR